MFKHTDPARVLDEVRAELDAIIEDIPLPAEDEDDQSPLYHLDSDDVRDIKSALAELAYQLKLFGYLYASRPEARHARAS